ncbi:MAG: TIM barrel protein [Anaerolineae bacterium]
MRIAAVISVDELTRQGTDWAPFLAMLQRFRTWGYDGVELAVRDADAVDEEALQDCLRAAGLPVAAWATGTAYSVDGLSFTHADAKVRRAAEARVVSHCRLAARLGGLVILGLVYGRVPAGVAREQAWQWMEAGVSAVCTAGRAMGVNLLFEPINRYLTDLVNTTEEGIALLDALQQPNLGLLLDTHHMNIEDADMAQAFMRAGSRVRHVHAVDSNRCYPGSGHVDFVPIISALRRIGYQGYLSAEILPRPDLDTALERAAANLRRLLA